MEAEMAEQIKTVIKQHNRTIAQLNADHLQELRKKVDAMMALSKKAALDCRVVNDVSCLLCCHFVLSSLIDH